MSRGFIKEKLPRIAYNSRFMANHGVLFFWCIFARWPALWWVLIMERKKEPRDRISDKEKSRKERHSEKRKMVT